MITYSNPASKPRLTAFSSRPTGLANPNITIPDATALATVTGWLTVVLTVTPQLPIAPGTQTGCTNYVNYRDTTVYDSLYQPQSPLNTYTVNLCSYVAASTDITVDYLLAWNPSLGTSRVNCSLAAGYSYCVAFGNNSKSEYHIRGYSPSIYCRLTRVSKLGFPYQRQRSVSVSTLPPSSQARVHHAIATRSTAVTTPDI
jgi:hypothetical protein